MKKIQSAQLLLLIFLLPSFFQRIFIGTEISSYSAITGVSLTLLGYAAHLVVILVALADKSFFKNKITLQYILPIVLLSLVHLLLLSDYEEDVWLAGALGIARLLIWLTACATISYYIRAEDFVTMLLKLIDIAFIVIVISSVLYYTLGTPFQTMISGGTPRAQAFFTEPSTVAAFLAGYLAIAFYLNDKKRILLSIVVIFFVNSVLVLIGGLVGIILGISSRVFSKKKWYRNFSRFSIISLMAILFSVASFSAEISNYANDINQSLQGSHFSNSAIYHIFVERILGAAMSFEDGIELIRNNENIDGGGLFRYTSMLLLLEQMSDTWRAFTGFGLGAHAQIMLSQDKSILDFGFLPLLISSFGYIIGALILYWIAKQLTKHHSHLSIFIIPFTVLSMFNSAGGIHTYSILLVSAFVFYKQKMDDVS